MRVIIGLSMHDSDEGLTTTTVSDPSPLVKFLLCSSSSLPLSKYRLKYHDIENPQEMLPMIFTKDTYVIASKMRTERNKRMLRTATGLCRTPRLDVSVVKRCIPTKYTSVTELTCGGMSRIYTAQSSSGENVVVKTTDCSRGLGLHEYKCYELLESKGLPTPQITYMAMYGKILIMILPNYAFSLASLLFALASRKSREDRQLLHATLHNVRYLLKQFKDQGISYCDFSPDNVMVDVDPRTMHGRLVLIDPQFALSTQHLTKKIGRPWAENIDRVHFAFKMRVLGMTDSLVDPIARKVCTEFLGNIPTEKETKRWILNVLPNGLRVAYDCIDRVQKKSSRKRYGRTQR